MACLVFQASHLCLVASAQSPPRAEAGQTNYSAVNPHSIEQLLNTKVGEIVKITYDGNTDTVTVISVDRDGLICRSTLDESSQSTPEFWVAFAAISSVEAVNPPESF
jgi:hypothetical protein